MAIIINKENDRYTMEEVSSVSITETECSHRIKPVALFNFMQDLAAKSIEHYDYDFGCEGLAKNNQGWYIIRYRVEIDDNLSDVAEIRLLTESRGCQNRTAFRDFEMYDKNSGKRILRATSTWFMIDFLNKSVINIESAYPDFKKFQKRDDDLELQKLTSISDADSEKVFNVRYDELDINNHVNNTVYVSWALDTLDYEFRAAHPLKSLDIYFKREVKYGDTVVSKVKIDKDNLVTNHCIQDVKTKEDVCLMRAQFQ